MLRNRLRPSVEKRSKQGPRDSPVGEEKIILLCPCDQSSRVPLLHGLSTLPSVPVRPQGERLCSSEEEPLHLNKQGERKQLTTETSRNSRNLKVRSFLIPRKGQREYLSPERESSGKLNSDKVTIF